MILPHSLADLKLFLQLNGLYIPPGLQEEIGALHPPAFPSGIVYAYLHLGGRKTAIYALQNPRRGVANLVKGGFNRYLIDSEPDAFISFDRYEKLDGLSVDGMDFRTFSAILPNGHLDYAASHHCMYFEGDLQCKFCTIGDWTNATGPGRQRIARAAKLASGLYDGLHVAITTGTLPSVDRGAEAILKLVAEFKRHDVPLPFSVEVEPVPDEYIERLRDSGATTMLCNLEVLDDDVREYVMPLKGKIPFSAYERHWQKSVEVFGMNQVFTNILLSPLDARFEASVERLERITDLGVIPSLGPMRLDWTRPEIMRNIGLPRFDLMRDLHHAVTEMLTRKNLDPRHATAGCHRDGCYSALREYYEEAVANS